MAASTLRPWRGALWAWLGMLIFVTLSALAFGPDDIDFSPGWRGRIEFIQFAWMILPLPLGLMSFGALAPMGFAANRLARRAGASQRRWTRALVGVGLALPAFIAFVIALKVPQTLGLLGSKRSTLLQDFTAIAHRPAQAIPFLLLFALGGVIFMLTSQANLSARREAVVE
jgi:hypothetical protein